MGNDYLQLGKEGISITVGLLPSLTYIEVVRCFYLSRETLERLEISIIIIDCSLNFIITGIVFLFLTENSL